MRTALAGLLNARVAGRRRVSAWAAPLLLLAIGLGASYASAALWPRVEAFGVVTDIERVEAHFTLCVGQVRENCVVDGDTLWVGGEKVRLADIDTPEVFSPKCAAELRQGQVASRRLLELVNAGEFTLKTQGRTMDKYGRALRLAERDGQSLGAILVAEGLARRWDGARHGWCL